MKFHIEILEGVPAIDAGNNTFLLVDTGSPLSFDKSGFINIFKNKYPVPTSLGGMIDAQYLQKNIHQNITGLIGMDIIQNHLIYFNYQEKFLTIDEQTDIMQNETFSKIPVRFTNKIPVVEIFLPQLNNLLQSLIDSGSKHSYVSSDFINNLSPIGEEQDFNPFLGHFQTTKYSPFEYRIGNTYYTHPICQYSKLSEILKMFNAQALLGFDLLNARPWVLDSKHSLFFYLDK